MSEYHVPVMLPECLEALAINPSGTYVDVTFGGGGHSRAILEKLNNKGRLLAFDQDADARRNLPADDRFTFIDQNFRYLKNNCRLYGASHVDGILADLGVSSHQFDQPERGFSTRFEANLDMRMDQSSALTAREVVNTYSAEALHRIFGMYGEIHNAKTLAGALVTARMNSPLETVEGLKSVAARYAPKGKENKYYAQVFQALRIEVNKELDALQEFLLQTVDVLREGGRLVVLSYHSLEDRLVKNFMAKGKFSGDVTRDFYGNELKPFQVVLRKALTASDEEVNVNSRARSAKLRAAERAKPAGQSGAKGSSDVK